MLAAVASSSGGGGGGGGCGPQEGIDHLLLLPERVLSMDSTSLRQDLAGLHFSLHLLQRAPAPQGNVWLSGAAPVDPNQKQSSSRPSSAKQGSSDRYGRDTWSDGTSLLDEGKENAAVTQRDREERLRQLKERQNEERQRKLEELKQQAVAAQKFREQKEEERRRRMEELRVRDNDRRHQVEERKRQIWEAERDRREAILRKNQEREARIESKRKNERSSIMFAFGSSTPRMLEPADTGGSYWATRSLVTGYDEGALKIDRKTATSTSNVMMLSMTAPPGPLTRRSSERELDGSKKRATSAGGINRNKEDSRMSMSIYDVFQWDTPPARTPPYSRTAPMSPVDLKIPSITIQQAPSQSEVVLSAAKGPGDEGDGATSANSSSLMAAARAAAVRRKTDLMPTIPAPRDRDLAPSRPHSSRQMRSPGRAYSMSRLDVLSRPRKRPTTPSPAPDPSLSRSMTHLAHAPGSGRGTHASGTGSALGRTRSMSQLNAPVPPPRPTRAQRLRRKARDAANASSHSLEQSPSPGLRSGEVTPSRPQSSLSQHSVSSSSGMTTSMTSSNVRSRPVATPRRPRPYSIAVTGISSAPDTPRQSLSSEHRAGKSGASANEKPPLPKVHTTKKQPAPAKPELAKKPTSEKIKSTKSSAATTPKATPLQSPGVDAPPLPSGGDTLVDITTTTTSTTATMVSNGGDSDAVVTVSETTTVITEQPLSPSADVSESKPQPTAAAPKVETPAAPAVQPPQPQNVQQDTLNELPESDMTASMIARKITTEEEAKAALAERRRLAREQAEREAELQRLRLEAERLAEEERLRQEEEEQRRAEEEQLRLLEEARAAEEVRLQEAIKETQKREEEERARKEEEEKLKKEKEEAERKAKEEAEKQRQEMEIRLKKEEEDRQARRKRVEAIMLRTRGKGTTPTSTPTKDGDELYDSSVEGVSNNGVEQFLNAERSQATSVETPNDAAATPKHNGHRNGVAVVDDNQALEKNNITNNLLDLSSLDTSQPAGEILQPTSGDTTTTTTNGKLANEDSVNFNNQSYIAFQDSNTVNDLLS
ncbi:MAP7 domain-containing protein 1 isoform X8 [Nilaparvata lugens]|uniref:MAP7 domain-containing protein 1 isoform X8 n=1 Tax=Nilaparvata lugens TaxID=108931 RepID=UPI00193E7766|nr:MAP7 domain-containing protein 1 isoform X8 [Nilaparvata lugens]